MVKHSAKVANVFSSYQVTKFYSKLVNVTSGIAKIPEEGDTFNFFDPNVLTNKKGNLKHLKI